MGTINSSESNFIFHLKEALNSNDKIIIPLIILVSWLTNYLLIQGYGLYYDDWPAIADHTKMKMWENTNGPLGWLEIWPHGRPVGWFFLSLLGSPGRESGELTDLYLVGFVIVSTIAVLIYLITKKKFGVLAGALTSILFLTSPVDTTRIEVTLNYIAHTGFIFTLLAIWLYQRQRKLLAYIISVFSLLSYESTFLPFVAAPLLTHSIYSKKTWKEQMLHGIICLLIIMAISAIRYWVFDRGFSIHQGQQDRNTLLALFIGLENYSIHFFNFFLFGIKQGFQNLSALSATIGLIVSTPLLFLIYHLRETDIDKSKKILELFVVGCTLLVLGLATSGIAEYSPVGEPFGGRNTRVFVSATFGGSVMICAMILLCFHAADKYKITPAAYALMLTILFGVSSNALKIQNDYVEAWDIQKHMFRAAIELSCDASLGDSIILLPQEPAWDKGRAILPYGFGLSTGIADTFDWGDTELSKIPTLMKAHKDWYKHLELRDDGKLHWKKLKRSGFYSLAMAPVSQQSIIYLKGTKRGLVRVNEPIFIDGVNIIKPEPSKPANNDCLFRERALTGPLAPFLYPDYIAFDKTLRP